MPAFPLDALVSAATRRILMKNKTKPQRSVNDRRRTQTVQPYYSPSFSADSRFPAAHAPFYLSPLAADA